MNGKQPLLVLVGPTAVGKTALSLQLAARLNGEIISADSRLFYRGLDIGTAKPSPAELAQVPHHFVDVCDPDETLTLAEYQRQAFALIDRIHRDGRLPILVGGTGQYVQAVVEGWGIPEVPPHPDLRRALEKLGEAELARWLAALDPAKTAVLDTRNVRRVVRALEVTLVSGRPVSELQRKTPPPYAICRVGLARSRESLYGRIDLRVDNMMNAGLLAEVTRLRDEGYGRRLPAMSGLGYRQLWAFLEGKMTLPEAVERIKFETHRFARQQNTWFHPDDPAIHWFDMDDVGGETAVLNFVQEWLSKT